MKLLMPYITAGITPDWTAYLPAFAAAGADYIEVGLPFSDPTLDGTTIQEATAVALARGATLDRILTDLEAISSPVPLVASTYANLVIRAGAPEFCARLRKAGFTALIVPDLPLEECAEVAEHIDLVLLAAPATPDARLAEIASRSRHFVYAVTVMGTTGERTELSASAATLAARLKQRTDLPVLLGFGISTPEQAAAAAGLADGVVVGAALMRRILDGATPDQAGAYVRSLRTAMSGG
ncbi:tryptophan synthase subunit alpha [Dactylosporangium sp. NPDC051541]|uniref:tryptophan synthase subunit alpha n=1 Tax=Dactylosporangium sp. NPDC051541 TaxID=3363977 RepID=UPI0037A4A72D